MNSLTHDLLLRIGLALVFIFAGVSAFLSPTDWIGYIPEIIEDYGMTRELALQLHAAGDIFLGAWILSGIAGSWAGFFAGTWLIVITVVSGPSLLLITFRDVGLAFAAFAYSAYARFR